MGDSGTSDLTIVLICQDCTISVNNVDVVEIPIDNTNLFDNSAAAMMSCSQDGSNPNDVIIVLSENLPYVPLQTYAFSFEYYWNIQIDPQYQGSAVIGFTAGSADQSVFNDVLQQNSDSVQGDRPSSWVTWPPGLAISGDAANQTMIVTFMLTCPANVTAAATVWIDNVKAEPHYTLICNGDESNILLNNNFECDSSDGTILQGWTSSFVTDGDGGSGQVSEVSPGSGNSTQAASLVCAGGGYYSTVSLEQIVNTVECQPYTLSFDYYFISDASGQDNYLYSDIFGSSGSTFGLYLHPTSDSLGHPNGVWVNSGQISTIGSGRSSVLSISLECDYGASATVWIDNVVLIPVGNIVSGNDCPFNDNLISNGDFETATSGIPSWTSFGVVSQVQPGYNSSTQAVSLSCSGDGDSATIHQTFTTTRLMNYELNFFYYWYYLSEWDSVDLNVDISPDWPDLFDTRNQYASADDEDYYGVGLDTWADTLDSGARLEFMSERGGNMQVEISLSCYDGSSATIYIDDVIIIQTPE